MVLELNEATVPVALLQIDPGLRKDVRMKIDPQRAWVHGPHAFAGGGCITA
jgi:hypothetical protein